jgi:hypothetical protein
MDISKIVARAQAILSNPRSEWAVVAGEQTTIKDLYLGYIMVLAAIGPVCGFFKMTLFGINVPLLGTYRVGFGAGLGNMLFSYVMALVGVYLVGMVINLLAPSFGGTKNDLQALKTVAYAYTAAWLAGVGQLLPWVGMMILLAGSLYSIYLLYLGLPVMMQCPAEKAKGYTAVAIVVAVIVGFVISAAVGGITGISGMMGGRSTPQATEQAAGGFDKNSVGGKMEDWAKKMESASKDMEKAQQSGDAKQQSEAMGKMMATALGNNGQIETLAPERIKAFLPQKLGGKARSDVSAERTGAMGMQISTAEASYEDQSGNGLHAEITDMGLAKGMMALAGWMGVEKESITETGFEKTYRKNNAFIHEQWDNQASSGEYTIIVGDRFSVKVSGSTTDISALKNAAGSINLDGLAALKDEGVK